MALSLLLDTVRDAELQQSLRAGSRFVRTGIVSGLTSDVTDSQLALMDALDSVPGMPDLGDGFHASYPQYILMYRIARGIEGTKGRKARVWLHYETLRGGGTPIERFAMQDVTSLIIEPRNTVPGTLQPMLCSLDNTSPDPEAATQPSTVRTITSSHPRSMRAIVLYGLFADMPSVNVLNAANHVNGATWQSKPAGYWRSGGPEARYSSRDGMYAVTNGFLTKGDSDWSTYEFARWPNGDLVTPKASLMTTLKAQPYAHGPRWDKNGVYKYGGYYTANFSAIFGDSFPIGD